MRRLLTAVSLLAAGLAAFAPRPAAACTCNDSLTLQEEFDYATVVFSGRVLSIQPGFGGMVEVYFQPLQRWKGPLEYVQRIVTPADEATCGFPFAVDGEYLVFAASGFYGVAGNAWFAGLCSHTSPLAGNPYLAELPPPLVTTPAARSSWGALKSAGR